MVQNRGMDSTSLATLLAERPSAPVHGLNAVRTTGIYCRDGCQGRPLARNVTRYPSAIAAEAAGYRPCLHCRPDRLPFQVVDGSAHEVVQRALALISQGVLDTETEDVLAGRLGVTARHLRRLFTEHLGATPAFVARARRAHFARRLLDETDLRMVEVAEASGFASVRQMNRVMLDVFRFTPTALRAKRRDADRLLADGGIRLRVPYEGALPFADLLAYLAPRAIPGVEAIEGGVYRRTTTTHGEPGVVEVADAGDGRHLLVVAHLPALSTLIDDVARIRRLFGLDRPAAEATPLAADPLLAPVVAQAPGFRVPGAWDPFESAIRILLGQQVTVAGATTLSGRLVEEFGTPVDGLTQMGLTHVFPSAVRLAEANVERLRSIGIPAARAEAIRGFSRAYADEQVRLDGALPMDDFIAALEALPGIGPWTAQLIALRAVGYADAFPSGDLGLRRAAGRLAGEAEPPPASMLEGRAEAWRPHRALAATLLWISGGLKRGG